jgi:phosphatidylglycerophosphatase A
MASVAKSPAYWIATWFGCGLARWAPGTVGSIGAIPLHLALTSTALPVHVAAIAVIAVLGVWCSELVARALDDKDPSLVVIDEVAGVLIALVVVRDGAWWLQLLAFALFRLLDITKPPPIRQAERAKPAGLGIMLDDLIAGAGAAALVWGIARFI